MNVEIGTETPIFLFWEYLFQNFGILSLQWVHISTMYMGMRYGSLKIFLYCFWFDHYLVKKGIVLASKKALSGRWDIHVLSIINAAIYRWRTGIFGLEIGCKDDQPVLAPSYHIVAANFFKFSLILAQFTWFLVLHFLGSKGTFNTYFTEHVPKNLAF